jgi:hypothetical protein
LGLKYSKLILLIIRGGWREEKGIIMNDKYSIGLKGPNPQEGKLGNGEGRKGRKICCTPALVYLFERFKFLLFSSPWIFIMEFGFGHISISAWPSLLSIFLLLCSLDFSPPPPWYCVPSPVLVCV